MVDGPAVLCFAASFELKLQSHRIDDGHGEGGWRCDECRVLQTASTRSVIVHPHRKNTSTKNLRNVDSIKVLQTIPSEG